MNSSYPNNILKMMMEWRGNAKFSFQIAIKYKLILA